MTATAKKPRYRMTISRLTVDKLGVKLYDRVSAVIAELIANCYDADASSVEVLAPMDVLLATKSGSKITDLNYSIEVRDNGCGMTPDDVNAFYLVVGAERRKDPSRGDISKKYHRKVMGRKGVGKLAPFGVCQSLEILSSGGKLVNGTDEKGSAARGYLTSHLILNRSDIVTDTDEEYLPKVGPLDGLVRKSTGTTLKLTVFDHRRVPTIESLERQLSQRFGVVSPQWEIKLTDTLKTAGSPNSSCIVGEFQVETMENTVITFEEYKKSSKTHYRTIGPDGKEIANIPAGVMSDGVFYPLTGWMGYSKQPYKDDLMAGVRIYCRGKFAAQTHIFNLKAGFTGEYDIRSYLVGQLNANWLDESEDLIRTDRQDILWSHELGRAFELWGQAAVKQIGALTREPRRKKAWQSFQDVSKLAERVKKAFPSETQKDIRENTMEIAKAIAQTSREDELQNPEQVEAIITLSLLLGPHITLDQKLREAAADNDDPLSVITSILRTARIAELSAFGQIADDRIRVIRRIEELKDDASTLEDAFQSLISEAPWLINPQWSPITSNQSFTTLKTEFEKFYKKQTGVALNLDAFSTGVKRADFVLSSQDNMLQIIEIKRPHHQFKNDEMERMNKYVELMDDFLDLPANKDFKDIFPKFHVTLVCDGLSLTGVHKGAFEGLLRQDRLSHINWKTFLLRTRKMHEAFLNEAERQRKDAAR